MEFWSRGLLLLEFRSSILVAERRVRPCQCVNDKSNNYGALGTRCDPCLYYRKRPTCKDCLLSKAGSTIFESLQMEYQAICRVVVLGYFPKHESINRNPTWVRYVSTNMTKEGLRDDLLCSSHIGRVQRPPVYLRYEVKTVPSMQVKLCCRAVIFVCDKGHNIPHLRFD